MIKVCISAARSLLNLPLAGRRHESINMLRVASFSYVSHKNENVHHNLGAPPPRTPPKVPTQVSVNNPDENSYNRNSREGDRSRTQDTTGYVADKARKGTKSAVETVFNVGESVAEGMEQSWGGIKETTRKIKDAVLGNDEGQNDGKHYGVGGDRKADESHGYVDKHVEDLRRKAGGYDQRPH